MFSKVRSRFTYANVTATLALFLALGGGAAWAANEWNSSNIQNETLTSADLKNNAAVKSPDVVDDSVTGGGLASADIRNDALNSNDVNALVGVDVTDDSLTGDDVNETSLGPVPSAESAEEVDGASFPFNRTGVIQPSTSVDVLNVANVGKVSAGCGTGGDSFTLTYTNQFTASQQQIADQRSEGGAEATLGDVLASGGTKNFSFTSDGAVNRGHTLVLQVAPSAQTSPNTQALTTLHVTALTQAGGSNTCRFQGSATVQ